MAVDPVIHSSAAPSRLTEIEERVARGLVASHRARLDWLLRVPEWRDLHLAGLAALALPGPRQGVAADAALLALPIEHKHELVRWVFAHCERHVRSEIGRQICRKFGLDLFERLECDELLTGRQWQRLRDAALFRLAQEHRRYKHAQQLLFTGYQQLVDAIVLRLVFQPGLRADCVQEGALGLLAAIDRADAGDGCFAAYAAMWIRRYVRNHLLRHRLPVQAPVNLISSTLALHESTRSTVSETAAERDGQADRLQVLLLEALRHPAVALDATDEENATIANTLADQAPSPVEQTAWVDLRTWVDRSLAELTDKQQHVLRRRFGLGGAPEQTLSEIARATGISHQQAGMRERRALRRLETSLAPIAAEWYGDA